MQADGDLLLLWKLGTFDKHRNNWDVLAKSALQLHPNKVFVVLKTI